MARKSALMGLGIFLALPGHLAWQGADADADQLKVELQ